MPSIFSSSLFRLGILLPGAAILVGVINRADAAVQLEENFEEQPFSTGNPPGQWTRGSQVYWENYLSSSGILDRAATDLGSRAVSMNPTPGDSWLYRDTGQPFLPNTTYTLTLFAGARKDSVFQGGGLIEFGLVGGAPANPASQPVLAPDIPGGNVADTSHFTAQTMTRVARYSFTTGSDTEGLGTIVVLVRNLASGNGRSTIDRIVLESDSTLPDRPNILWLVAEDMSPTLGCYGDPNAITPSIDALAATGFRFDRCWSNAPFCSVARTTLISGTHATRGGGSMHRSTEPLTAPGFMRFYPRFLQEAGYYTSNNSKEDYNLVFSNELAWRKGWNDSSGTAHWRNRPAGQPFFSVFNLDVTHESRIRPVGGNYNIPQIHDAAEMVLPACHPDIPSLREAWARHHDTITRMDTEMAAILAQLEADGLAEDTIVFFYSDHGSCVPGYKRFVGNRGQQTPLIVRFPEKYRHLAPEGYQDGGSTDELVSFVDFAPTLLSLLDCPIPDWMHGRAFAGPGRAEEPDYLAGYICRHDTRYANARSVTDGRYVFIRNYQSGTPDGNWSAYTNGDTGTNPAYGTLGAGEWLRDFWQGKLTTEEGHFFRNQGYEQLYDLATDPHETINLAGSADHAEVLAGLRAHLDHWHGEIRDGGLLAEGQLYDLLSGSALTAWDVIGDDSLFDVDEVLDTARRANSDEPEEVAVLASRLSHADPSVRLWAVRGLGYHGRSAVRTHQAALVGATADSSYWVATAAREVLARHATEPNRTAALDALFDAASLPGVIVNGVTNLALERRIHFAGDAISSQTFLPSAYRNRTGTMNNETYLTRAYRRQIFYWFFDEFSHPLAEFRQLHGLEKTGADDLANPSGDGVSNLLRYSFNMAAAEGELEVPASPRMLATGGDSGLPSLVETTLGGRFLFIRPKAGTLPRVKVLPQFSPDLRTWQEDRSPAIAESIDGRFERVSLEVADSERAFFRVAVLPVD